MLSDLAESKHSVYDWPTSIERADGIHWVIRSFADKETESLFVTERSRRLPQGIVRRALVRLYQLHFAKRIEDLRNPPSNRLEALKGDRADRWSIRINDQWRVCFRFESSDAFDVEIIDYH